MRDHLNEDGFTVVELLVALVLGLTVMAVCLSVLVGAQRRSDLVERRTGSQLRARAAIDTAQRSLRAQACLVRSSGAPLPPLVSGTDTQVTFYADLAGSGSPTLRKLELAGGTLSETVWPDAAGSGTPTVRRLATGLDQTVPLLRYYAYDTSQRPPTPRLGLAAGTSGLSATDRARVARVALRVAANAEDPRTEVQNSVLVRLTDPDGSVVPLCV